MHAKPAPNQKEAAEDTSDATHKPVPSRWQSDTSNPLALLRCIAKDGEPGTSASPTTSWTPGFIVMADTRDAVSIAAMHNIRNRPMFMAILSSNSTMEEIRDLSCVEDKDYALTSTSQSGKFTIKALSIVFAPSQGV
jgi:hypothetical protein